MFLKGFTQQARKFLRGLLLPVFAINYLIAKSKNRKKIIVTCRRCLLCTLAFSFVLGILSITSTLTSNANAYIDTDSSISPNYSPSVFRNSNTSIATIISNITAIPKELSQNMTLYRTASSEATNAIEGDIESKVSEEDVSNTSSDIHIYDISLEPELQEYAYEMVQKYEHLKDLGETGYLLMLSTAFVESNYNFDAISASNDYGAYQINISNHKFLARDYGLTDMLDPYQNTEAAAIILNNCLDAWESWDLSDEERLLAVANSYNMGVQGYQNFRNGGSHYQRAYGLEILDGIHMLETSNTISDEIRN